MTDSQTAYVVTSGSYSGYTVERVYLDRAEAQRFVDAYNNATRGDCDIEEFPIGQPLEDYDGPCWEAEWIESHYVEPLVPNSYAPFWTTEVLWIKSDWHTGSALPKAAVTWRRATHPPGMVKVRGTSKGHVEKVLYDTIAQVKAEMAGIA